MLFINKNATRNNGFYWKSNHDWVGYIFGLSFGFLIMMAVYKFQDKEIDKLIEDVFFG